jgi:hypothetical protein
MIHIPFEPVQSYRARTYRLLPGMQLNSADDAVAFVNERGFVYFWPINGVNLPSLWAAVAGDRPVADAHDDPGHKTWGWKDSLLGKHRWYYAKVIKKKATMISLEVAPYFYALSENYGSPEEDYLTLYEQGRLTQEAKTLYEVLLRDGPLDTVALRKAARLSSSGSDSRFNKALTDLQADFKILPVGVTDAGAWHYAFAYDIVTRHYPELPDLAQKIGEAAARRKLACLYLYSLGAVPIADLTRLFGWRPAQTERAVNELLEAGEVRRGILVEGRKGEWAAVRSLI